jgi:hypothetical protein
MDRSLGLIFLAIAIIASIVIYVFLNLRGVYFEELRLIPTIAGFYTFAIGFFVPVEAVLRIGWNPVAGRAVNPITKRFVPTWMALIAIVGFGLIWYFIVLAQLNHFFLTGLEDNLVYSLSSVLWFGIWTFFVGALLTVVFAALAVPSRFGTALGFKM